MRRWCEKCAEETHHRVHSKNRPKRLVCVSCKRQHQNQRNAERKLLFESGALQHPEHKKCAKCKKEKMASEFIKHYHTSTGLGSYCLLCHAEINIASKYGMSPETLKKFKKDRNNQCEVCGSKKSIVVDHNHETGVVRGLLCNNCNAALGFVEEDTYRLANLADYLHRKEGKPAVMIVEKVK